MYQKPTCESPFTIEFENDELPKEELKRLIFNETLNIKNTNNNNFTNGTHQEAMHWIGNVK